MSRLAVPTLKFYNGNEIPAFGLGTWKSKPGEVTQAVKDAIDIGYRHIDCAYIYGNQKEVGAGIAAKIKENVVKRKDLFITSKLWNTFHKPDLVEPAIKQTLTDLGLEYLDLYLIHWPVGYKEGENLFPKSADGSITLSDVDYVDTWKAMEAVLAKGLAKNIGISNFNSEQITRLLEKATVKPVTNQIECHPYLTQKELSEFCKNKGILITAYSPLGSPDRPWAKPDDPKLLEEKTLNQIAETHHKTPAQILIRYQLDRGHIVIPKSVTKSRILENSNVFDFKLTPEDMKHIDSFERNGRICPLSDESDVPTSSRRRNAAHDAADDDDDNDDEFSLVTVASGSLRGSTLASSTVTGSVYTDWEERFAYRPSQRRGRVFSYRKRRTHVADGIFSAPDGVCPCRVTSSIVRRNAGDSRLVFVWPRKAGGGRLSSVLAPLLRGVLVGLLLVDALHLWPGEFLPTTLPSVVPIALPPVKCNVIEPRWFDNN